MAIIDNGTNANFKSISGVYHAGMNKKEVKGPAENVIMFEIYDSGAGKDKAGDDKLGKYEILEIRKGELAMMREEITAKNKELTQLLVKANEQKKNNPELNKKISNLESEITKLENTYSKEETITNMMKEELIKSEKKTENQMQSKLNKKI